MRTIGFTVVLTLAPLLLPSTSASLTLEQVKTDAPYVLADQPSRTYYLYAAALTNEHRWGVVAYTSRDLTEWQNPRVVFTVPDGLWARPEDGLWAPEVHVYLGRYYLFVTLTNSSTIVEQPPQSWRTVARRGVHVFVATSPTGPFTPVGPAAATPEDFATSGGTLFVEGGVPYLVFAHDWQQTIDGAIEAVRLSPDLAARVGDPFRLFRASDAPWLADQFIASKTPRHYPAEGPFLHRTRAGTLLLIWSSTKDGLAAVAVAASASGTLRGPWRQATPLLTDDTGHAMILRTFDGRLMLVAQHPTGSPLSSVRLGELEDTGDTICPFHVLIANDLESIARCTARIPSR
jgi:hypothetical protein